METSKAQGKGILMDNEDDEEEEDEAIEGDNKKKRAVKPYYCQVEDCITDLTDAKPYHRRHKVCEFHAKAAVVLVSGIQQRFCQQCSRFHQLSEFDEAKRSCRRRLAGHNERRRKSSYDPHEGRS